MINNKKYKSGNVKVWEDVGLLDELNSEDKIIISKLFGKTYTILSTKKNISEFVNIAMLPIIRRIYNNTKKGDLNIKYVYDKFNKFYKENTTIINEINIVGGDGEAEMVNQFCNIIINEINNKNKIK